MWGKGGCGKQVGKREMGLWLLLEQKMGTWHHPVTKVEKAFSLF